MVKIIVAGAVGLWILQAAVPASGGEGDHGCEGTGQGVYRVVELRGRESALVLFGTRHRTDPADPVWAELEQRVAALRPTVILVEGDGPPEPTRELAITHGGDGGFLCWLATQRRVPCRSLDLPEPEEARRLLLRHDPDEVLLFLTVRALAYFNPRPTAERPPGDLVQWALRRYGPMAGLPAATEAGLGATCERVLHRSWDPSAVTTDWHDPRKSDLQTQRISRESDELREPYMLERLLASPGGEARVFAVVGEGHLCNLQADLRARWEEARKVRAGASQR